LIIEDSTKQLRDSDTMHGIIQSGDRPPSFAWPNHHGKEINSAELLASGPVVITVFLPSW
jgi:hypothetical protein